MEEGITNRTETVTSYKLKQSSEPQKKPLHQLRRINSSDLTTSTEMNSSSRIAKSLKYP